MNFDIVHFNVPADIINTVSMLPRLTDDIGTIKVNLKRRLQYKSSGLFLNVKPHKAVQAANWLANNSSLYREEGITFNQNWLEHDSNVIIPVDTEQHQEQSQNMDCDASNITKTQVVTHDEDQ